MRSAPKVFAPGGLTVAEEAVQMLRTQGAVALAEYYLGSLPFLLALLYFWGEMSRSPFARWYCAPAAAGLALLYVWMKLWQVRFCRRLWAGVKGVPAEPWPLRRTLGTAARQAAVHATGFLILPLTALVALPLGWAYAFYQNTCVLEEPEGPNLRGLCKAAMKQAALWPGQNHVLLAIFTALALVVFANLGIVLFGLPYLIKGVLGVETVFTIGVEHVLNTTFLAAVCALTYLCVDPIIKAAYVLRCYYGLSRHTGDDLAAALKPYLGLAAMGFLLCMGSGMGALAQESLDPQPPAGPHEVVRQLDVAIDRVLQKRAFTWRLPRAHEEEPSKEQTWWSPFFRWIGDGVARVGRALARWVGALIDWLAEQLAGPAPERTVEHRDWAGTVRFSLYVLGGALLIVLLIVLRRWWKRKGGREVPAHAPVARPEIDVTDESVMAADLPRDRWLTLAGDLMGRQDFRGALRALYLAALALLADHGRLDIARHKSNRDYFRELARRGHCEPELMDLFDRCIDAFERAWYGMHGVERPQVEQFAAYHQRMIDLVRP